MKQPLAAVALWYVTGLLLGRLLPLSFSGACVLAALCALGGLWLRKAERVLLPAALLMTGWVNYAGNGIVLSPLDLRLTLPEAPLYGTVRGRLLETPYERVSLRKGKPVVRTLALLEAREFQVANSTHWQPAVGTVIASTPQSLGTNFFGGQEVLVEGLLQPPEPPVSPGQFNYAAYLASQGIHRQLQCHSPTNWHAADPRAPARAPLIDRFCAWGRRTLARGLPEEDDNLRLLWAMVLGWKTGLTEELSEPFMQSGTFHIFAISGLHIALLALILSRLLRVLQLPRTVCGCVVIPLLWWYTAATGWQASAIRSTIMSCVLIGGWMLRRPGDLVNSLAFAGLIILVWDPAQLFQAGFQLSFLVVLGLALLLPPLEEWRKHQTRGDPFLPPELRPLWQRVLDEPWRFLTANFATSVAAWVASVPLIALYFHLLTPVSLLANLVVVPLSSLALMSSLGSLCCGDWLPWLTEVFNHASWGFMDWMVGFSRFVARLPLGWFRVPEPSLWEVGIYYILLTLALLAIRFEPAQRRRAALAAAVLLVVGFAPRWWHRNELVLTVLPQRVGGVYVDAPGTGADLLLDAGNETDAHRLLEPFLEWKGVNQLDGLVLAQATAPHLGGAGRILELFPPRRTYTADGPARSPTFKQLQEELKKRPDRWGRVQAGESIGPWRVLHPAPGERATRAADATVVLRGELRGTRVLLLSDLSRTGQNLLLARGAELRADVLVVNAPEDGEPVRAALLEAVGPRVILVGNGARSPRNSERQPFLRALRQHKVPVLETSRHGALRLVFNEGEGKVEAGDELLYEWRTESR